MSACQFVRATRADLVTALFGESPKGMHELEVAQLDTLGNDEVGLLYCEGRSDVPAAIVVNQREISDFFAWLDTYAPQFSPLTQFCRVISPEWAHFYKFNQAVRRKKQLTRALAGVVVGEVIAQTPSVVLRSLDSATLAHGQATFSLCLARNELLRDAGFEFGNSVRDGLQTLSAGFMAERRLDIKDVSSFWSAAFDSPMSNLNKLDPAGALGLALEELKTSGLSHSTIVELARHYEPARELVMMQTYSAERRVKFFDRLIGEVGSASSGSASEVEDFCLAYAAVEIGGGSTRHAALLQNYGERRPIVWLWFGLLASLGDGDKWHPAFARVGRLVQRELEYSFDVWDPPRADIALEELLSLKNETTKTDWITQLPRAHSRTLSVEIVPSVSFQFSLAAIERRDPPVATHKFDVHKLDQAIGELWAFRQSLVDVDTKPKPRAAKGPKRAKPSRDGKGLF